MLEKVKTTIEEIKDYLNEECQMPMKYWHLMVGTFCASFGATVLVGSAIYQICIGVCNLVNKLRKE